MAMQAPKTEATGTSGQSFVKAHFEKLGWGVMPNPEHDVGTDMLVQARDDAGIDLGLLLGVQVKSGPSHFKEPCEEDGTLVGWWFREDEDHFNYWLEYQAAHIVVLHDQDTGIAYWVQVTADEVVPTGKDCKILVPNNQTVDAGHQPALIKAAESKARLPQWEGTAWELTSAIADASKLRYALVAPRLLAPHPNGQVEELSAEQAVALFVLQRFQDIERLKEKFPLLDPAAAAGSGDWTWQLYGALRDWGSSGERSGLDTLVSTATNAPRHAAVAVCVSHAMFEDGDLAGARAVVEGGLAVSDLSPSDRRWLQAHKARVVYELGDLDAAREMALAIKGAEKALLGDPSVRVLLGSAAQLLLNLGDWSPESLADVVRGRDNMVNLWRNQVVSEGLGKQVEDLFRDWAPDGSVTFGAADVPWLKFRSAMLLAGYAADTSSWSYAAVLLARRQLLATGDKQVPDWVLDLLRLAGAEKDVRRVANRLLKSGPVDPLRQVASQLDLSHATRTSLQASISLVERAADLLPSDVCDRHAAWVLGVLRGTDDTPTRLKPRFFIDDALLKMLGALWRGLTASAKDEVKAHILGLPTVEDQLVAGGYARLLRRIEDEAWSDNDVDRLAGRPDGDNFELSEAIERLRASRSSEFRASLATRIAQGDLRALESYGSVTDLPGDVAGAAIRSLAEKVNTQTESARKGAYGMGGHDLLRALVLLNVWHPTHADWQTCYAALAEPKTMPEHIEGSLDLVAAMVSHIDSSVRAELRVLLGQIRDRESFPSAFEDSSAGVTVRGAATVALALMFPETVEPALLTRLVRGDVGQRSAAARILIEREDEAALITLAALSKDVDLGVRSFVAGGLARWVVKGVAPEASLELVVDMLNEPGVDVGLSVAGALSPDADTSGSKYLANLLADHPSTAVRSHAERMTAGSEPS
jgi:hypothetical protein